MALTVAIGLSFIENLQVVFLAELIVWIALVVFAVFAHIADVLIRDILFSCILKTPSAINFKLYYEGKRGP